MKDHEMLPQTRASSGFQSYEPIRLDLPAKASELLALALKELSRVEKDPRYSVDMQKWHMPSLDGSVCSVCLAGAMLTRHIAHTEIVGDPNGRFDPDTLARLMAIDLMRCGSVRSAIKVLDQCRIGGNLPSNRFVQPYSEHPAMFREDMRLMLQELKDGEY